jgi:branched-chain amino acid transport system substrate-binding protein
VEIRLVWAQYNGFKDNDIDQFRSDGRQTIVQPEQLATGKVIAPFNKARA